MAGYYPKWAKELKRFCSIKSQFLLCGNIYDIYPYYMNSQNTVIPTTLGLKDYLNYVLKEEGYDLVFSFEPKYGFKLVSGKEDYAKEITGYSINKENYLDCGLKDSAVIIEKIVNNKKILSIVQLNFSSRYGELSRNEIDEFYYKLFRLSLVCQPVFIKEKNLAQYNLVLWILEKDNDLPAWFNIGNYRIKSLNIPKPDYETRKIIVELLSKNIKGFEENNQKVNEIKEIFIGQTTELQGQEIASIVSIAKKENLSFFEIGEAIRRYKLGIEENPWSKLNLEVIKKSEDILKKDVFGQEKAVTKAADIIKRSVFNLSGSQYSSISQRPKGVLFFAGPTGVGKTELAKSITKLIFGNETSYIRFDMSEFSKEHSDQRLIGAPPGYVGYETGGELINSIKAKPFSVILFDEIEKAHSKILDIFLQILDDGRLTSGRGELAYFSESLIIFTSNLGVYERKDDGTRIQRISPEMEYSEIEKRIKDAINDFFKYKINRAEILNRIGENIVVFDFIRKDVALNIVNKMINRVKDKLLDTKKITVNLTSEALGTVYSEATKDLSMGGRGIGNVIEDVFINTLSRTLFEIESKEGENLIIEKIVKEDNRWKMLIKR